MRIIESTMRHRREEQDGLLESREHDRCSDIACIRNRRTELPSSVIGMLQTQAETAILKVG